jgi:hypothetical protein
MLLLSLWHAGLVMAFALRAEAAIEVLALIGTLIWTLPAGLSLGWLFRRRYHVAWIFPAALPATFVILYMAFTSAEILPMGSAVDLHPGHMPGKVHVAIAMTVCPFAAAGVAFGFLAYPRPYANPKRCRCIRCDYDIRGSIDIGRCPECGHRLIPGVDYPTVRTAETGSSGTSPVLPPAAPAPPNA